MITTRFAPSPTGFMHIGNLRSALYSYLVAKNQNGKFVLRIEDTDKVREVEGAIEVILNTLKKTNLKHDDYFVQSDRKDIYFKYATELIDKGFAYYCLCSKEEMECKCRERNVTESFNYIKENDVPFAIRFKMPREGNTSFYDEVFGKIEVENKSLDDIILIKSDGFPTYNCAHIIDDYEMGITHVVRGSEYLASTPKYVNIYKAFGWQPPTYVHLPLIMGKDENGNVSKLSKRHGAVSFEDLVSQGYLPEAIINYIAFLGWNPKTNKEIYSLEELKEDFSIKKINKSPAVFDYVKLDWFNKQYISKLSFEEFDSWCSGCINNSKVSFYMNLSVDKLNYIKKILQKRVSNYFDFIKQYKIITEPEKADKTMYQTNVDADCVMRILIALRRYNWNINSVEDATKALKDICDKLNLKMKQVAWVARIALTGKLNTPGGATDFLYLYDNLASRFESAYNDYLI